jgi:pimeloyl-ACP methyl ester carboxylesterase
LQRSGQVLLRSPYDPEGTIISAALIEDGEQQCLLDRPIAIDCPVRLLQGMADSEVPWQIALRLATALAGTDVQVRLIKDGDHRLSAPAQLALLGAALDEVLAGSATA